MPVLKITHNNGTQYTIVLWTVRKTNPSLTLTHTNGTKYWIAVLPQKQDIPISLTNTINGVKYWVVNRVQRETPSTPPQITGIDYGRVQLTSNPGTIIDFNGIHQWSGSWWDWDSIYSLNTLAYAYYPASDGFDQSNYSAGTRVQMLGKPVIYHDGTARNKINIQNSNSFDAFINFQLDGYREYIYFYAGVKKWGSAGLNGTGYKFPYSVNWFTLSPDYNPGWKISYQDCVNLSLIDPNNWTSAFGMDLIFQVNDSWITPHTVRNFINMLTRLHVNSAWLLGGMVFLASGDKDIRHFAEGWAVFQTLNADEKWWEYNRTGAYQHQDHPHYLDNINVGTSNVYRRLVQYGYYENWNNNIFNWIGIWSNRRVFYTRDGWIPSKVVWF